MVVDLLDAAGEWSALPLHHVRSPRPCSPRAGVAGPAGVAVAHDRSQIDQEDAAVAAIASTRGLLAPRAPSARGRKFCVDFRDARP